MQPLEYMSFYEADPLGMPGLVNLAHDWDLGILLCMAESGMRILPDVSSVFFFRPFVIGGDGKRTWSGPLKLRPDYPRTWKCFLDLISPLAGSGHVHGVFLGDELLWNGARPEDIQRATSIISETLGNRMIYLNEYTWVFSEGRNYIPGGPIRPDAAGKPTPISVSELGVTHISIDDYRTPEITEQIYRDFLYPRMSPRQQAFIVPQAYASTYDPWESGRQAASAAERYVAWARRDPRIVGINPWHWFSYTGPGFECRAVDGNGNPKQNSVGVLDSADLYRFWNGVGRDIVQSSRFASLAASSLRLVHRFVFFEEGEALPTTFSTDPNSRGGSSDGMDDPLAPSADDVCFSKTRGSRTSILLKHRGAAFRYSWGNIPRVFEGIDWVAPRTGAQVIRFSLWLDSLSDFALIMTPQFGGQSIVRIDFSQAELLQRLQPACWNDIELRLDLNASSCSVAVGGIVALQTAMQTELTMTEVLVEGGPAFLSELELRAEATPFVRAYRSECQATNPLQTLCFDGSRVGAMATTGEAYVKDLAGERAAAYWQLQGTEVKQLVLDGARVGILKKDGNVFVKEGPLDAPWSWESSDVQQLVLEGSRIGVLKIDGNVYVKEGPLDAYWSWESSNVKQLVLEGSRIGVLQNDGNVYVKEGALDAYWTLESGDVEQLVLEGSRIGILKKDGNVCVNEGPLDVPLSWESSGVKQLVLEGSRIGVLQNDGNLYVKEGPLNAYWTLESGDTRRFVLDGSRIGVIKNSGEVYVKEGSLDAEWSWETSETIDLVLAGQTIVALHANGVAYLKQGALNAYWTQLNGSARGD